MVYRRILFTIMAAVLCAAAAGCSASTGGTSGEAEETAAGEEWADDPVWSDEESLKAFVISDLHYTENREADGSVVPGIAMAEEITDALLAQVIAEKPDVFIMTGDNTDSGYADDVSGLVKKLQKVRDAGIPVILTTGNPRNRDINEPCAVRKSLFFNLLQPVWQRNIRQFSAPEE